MSKEQSAMAHSALVIDCRQVTRTYNEGLGKLTIFSDISLEVAQGETVAIVGSSGAGKTTLLNLLGGLDKPSSGQISICGEDIHRLSEGRRARFRNAHLGFVYQFHHLLPEFSAVENVAMPCMIAGQSRKAARAQATELLEQVGLAERLEHRPSQLSGGEQQRVAIARALANQPSLLLADEPTGNLDQETGDRVFQMLADLVRTRKLAALIATHDRSLAARLDRVVTIDGGKLVELSTSGG